jgi:hypothetical protein
MGDQHISLLIQKFEHTLSASVKTFAIFLAIACSFLDVGRRNFLRPQPVSLSGEISTNSLEVERWVYSLATVIQPMKISTS